MDLELERFKRDVNLSEFAASVGYQLVRRERSAGGKWRGSSPASILMRHPSTNDKIVIRRDVDGHWTYFSVRDDRDSGSVIDFIQHRRPVSLAEIRVELRDWLHLERPAVAPELYRSPLRIQTRDALAVAATYARACPGGASTYLDERGISLATLRNKRFADTFRIDSRGNVLFAHRDPERPSQIVGFEIKNRGFTSFAPGGRRTLWTSNPQQGDDRLVILEGTIDALSYHQIHPSARARYISTAGSLGAYQLQLVQRAVAEMRAGGVTIIATDNDQAGERIAGRIEELIAGSFRTRRHRSPVGKDWNDCLRAHERQRGDRGRGERPLGR